MASRTGASLKRDAVRAKARHFYLLGSEANASGNQEAAYEYFKRAWLIDPGYDAAGYNLAVLRISNTLDSLQTETEVKRSLEMIRSFADHNPGDIQESVYYGYLMARMAEWDEAARIFRRIDSIKPTRTETLLELAEVESARGRLDSALRDLERYERLEGHSANLSMRKVQLLFAMHDTIGAVDTVSGLIRRYPADPQYLLLRSQLYETLGRAAEREADLTEAERIAPGNGDVKVAIAEMALARGDSMLFDKKITEALTSDDFDFNDKKELLGHYLTSLLEDSVDNRRGDQVFKALLAQYPHEPALLDMEARLKYNIGDIDAAVESAEYASQLAPDNPQYWQQAMFYEWSDGRYADVMSRYRKASQAGIESEGILNLYAMSALMADSIPQAVDAYVRLLRPAIGCIDPTMPWRDDRRLRHMTPYEVFQTAGLFVALGDAWSKSKVAEEEAYAPVSYETALYIDPDNVLALNNYSYFLTERGKDLESARKMAERVMVLEPDNPTYVDTYAWTLYKSGNYAEALKEQQRAIQLSAEQDSESDEYYRHLAAIWRALGDKTAATEADAKADTLKAEKSK